MPAPDFDAKYEALRARLADSLGITVYRRDLTSEDLAGRMPAVSLRVTGMTPENEQGCPSVWTLGALAVVYARNTAKDGSADTVLLGFVADITNALKLQPGELSESEEQTTLGGAVFLAWVSGEVEFMQGESSDQAAALVPIEMVVPEG